MPAPAVGACRADLDQLSWGGYPVAAAFIANQILGSDLPAGATSAVTAMEVDGGALSAQVLIIFRALGPLAFSAVESRGQYGFELTFDPGDGVRTASLSVPVTCRALAAASGSNPASVAAPATPATIEPAFTG